MQKRIDTFLHLMQKCVMKLAELIDVIAATLGMRPSEVKTRARYIRESGFLSSGARGKGAPDMLPSDLAALCLGMMPFSEPTASGFQLKETRRARFDYSRWDDFNELHKSLGASEDKPQRFSWSPAPLSNLFGDSLTTDDPLWCLQTIFAQAAKSPDDISVSKISSQSDKDGILWKFEYRERVAPSVMKDRLVRWSGDSTDGWAFSDATEKHDWIISVKFLLSESQSDRRNRTIGIDGDILNYLIRMCSQKWGDKTP